jgi:hypothetical protein
MERDSHDTISAVERLLHSIAMVDVNVDVEHTLVFLQELKDAQHNVVDVAETGRFALLRVVKTTSPVDCNVGASIVQLGCTSCVFTGVCVRGVGRREWVGVDVGVNARACVVCGVRKWMWMWVLMCVCVCMCMCVCVCVCVKRGGMRPPTETSASRQLTELVEAVKHGAVFTHVEARHLLRLRRLRVQRVSNHISVHQ